MRRALATAFLNRYSVFAIGAVSMLVLSRLLTPAEIGQFSVAVSIVLLAQGIRDFGAWEYLVQERDLTPEKIRTAFCVTLVIAWTLGLLIFLSRGWIAAIYRTPELADLIAIASLSFVVAPFSSTVTALLNREMAFGTILRISISSNLVNAVVSIVLAWQGWGSTSLIIGTVAMNATTAVVASFFAQTWDHIIPSVRAWRQVFAFGAYMSVVNIINQTADRAPDLIIGRLLGYQTLGIYNRALGTVALFNSLITSSVQAVVFPAFAAYHREGKDLREAYLRVVSLTTGVAIPVLSMVAITAQPLIVVLLGDQWLPAVPLIPILVVAAVVDGLAPMARTVAIATERVSGLLRMTMIVQGCQIASVVITTQFGLLWVIGGQVVCAVISFVVSVGILRDCIGLRARDLLQASLRSAVLAVWTGAPTWLIDAWLLEHSGYQFVRLILAWTIGSAAWLVGIYALRHPCAAELAAVLARARDLARQQFTVSR